jgi:hypothetical protein
VAFVLRAGLRYAATTPTESRAATRTVANSMSLERLAGSGESPINHRHHSFNPSIQSCTESLAHSLTQPPPSSMRIPTMENVHGVPSLLTGCQEW